MRNLLGHLLLKPNTRIHMKLIHFVILVHFITASLPLSCEKSWSTPAPPGHWGTGMSGGQTFSEVNGIIYFSLAKTAGRTPTWLSKHLSLLRKVLISKGRTQTFWDRCVNASKVKETVMIQLIFTNRWRYCHLQEREMSGYIIFLPSDSEKLSMSSVTHSMRFPSPTLPPGTHIRTIVS